MRASKAQQDAAAVTAQRQARLAQWQRVAQAERDAVEDNRARAAAERVRREAQRAEYAAACSFNRFGSADAGTAVWSQDMHAR
jgi:hypothetical protein